MSYVRTYATYETVIVGLLLLAFVVGLAQLSEYKHEHPTTIGIHRASESSSPALE